MSELSDLEITKRCAKAVGMDALELEQRLIPYDPLHDDAQAMALVKKFGLFISRFRAIWYVDESDDGNSATSQDENLNRAICLCVAKMVSK